jgi:hypothetical protein
VDVFATDPLRPFARVGLVDFLLAMAGLTLSALQSLDAEFRWYDYASVSAVTLPGAALLLVLPMWGVHRALGEAKARALAAVQDRIAGVDRGLAGDALAQLNGLLERRRHLRAVHTWPLDPSGIARVAFYLVIPPLAWVAAALVELAVDRWVAGG